MKVIRYTIFDSDQFGNGAKKRTAQIGEILENSTIQCLVLKKDDNLNIRVRDIFKCFINVSLQISSIIPISYFKGIKRLLRAVRNYISAKEQLSHPFLDNINVLLWECTRNENFFVPILAKKLNKKVVAITHNLESLVPNQISTISFQKAPLWFEEEIKMLSKCNMVFCISKEETYILNLFNINAFYLPYYPTKTIEDRLLLIRSKRIHKTYQNNRKKIIMVGSADNQPTILGMINRIQFFSNFEGDEFEFLVAGFNTELLNDFVPKSNKKYILGTLDLAKLEDLLVETDYILIHQPPTSGALTRIPEMLIAGIPIILNFPSARDFFNMDGIYIYENDENFLELLRSDIQKIPDLPIKPGKEIKQFIQKIKSFEVC